MIEILTIKVRCVHYDCQQEDEGSKEELEQRGWLFKCHSCPYIEECDVYCKVHHDGNNNI